jgi:hypothetical protein
MGHRESYLVAGQSLVLSSISVNGTSGYYRCADSAVFVFRYEHPANP